MMRNLWLLFKVQFLNNLGINKFQKKFASKSRFGQVGSIILVTVLALLVLAGIGLYLYMFFSFFILAGRFDGMLLFGVTIGVIFSLLTSFSIANSYLFESKDYDLLMALPIKPRTIIASKVGSLLVINYFFYALIYIPSVVIYSVYVGPGLLFYIISIIIFFVGPLLAITIASTIAYFANILVSRFKFKNAIKTIGMLIFFLAVMFLSFSFNSMPDIEGDEIDPIITMVDGMINTFEKIYYPGIWAVEGMTGNFLLFLAYLAITVLPFIIFIYSVGHNFSKAVARMKVSYTNKNFKLGEQRVTSQLKALVKREFKTYFSNASVVINTAIGPILGTGVVLTMLSAVEESTELLGSNKSMIVAILLGISLFMNGMMSTTSNSISLEGDMLWIIKSAPVDAKEVFKAKILINFIISLPFIIINTVIVGIFLTPRIFDLVIFLIIPILFNLVEGTYGLLINLCFPKLEWDNPVKVVKQSLSTLITMLSGIIFVVGLIVGFVYLYKFGITIIYISVIFILSALLALFILILNTNGKKRYYRLKA